MAAKSDGPRQYLKKCACGREFNGGPILGKVTNYYKRQKTLKKGLTSDIIESERKEGVQNDTNQNDTKELQNRNDKHKNR